MVRMVTEEPGRQFVNGRQRPVNRTGPLQAGQTLSSVKHHHHHHYYHHHHHHQSLNREGRSGITDDFATSFLHFSPVLHCRLGPAELQACPFPEVVFPPLLLSALSSSPFHCALQDGFGQTC